MMKSLRAALVAFALLTLITGVIYPLLITGIGQALFPYQANGSLIERDGQIVGAALIGQSTDDPAHFWARPSANAYMQGSAPDALIASSGTNAGWTNAALAAAVTERADAIRAAHDLPADVPIPPDLLFASSSGLDPHISPEAAALQIERIATARGVDAALIRDLVAHYTESPQLGVFGQPRVNVLLLNLALDALSQ
jgi:K+-transporting ATPase ATPase C chain